MKNKKILGLLFLLFICVLFGCVKQVDNQKINNSKNTETKDRCPEIWCTDAILVENNRLKVIFKDSYHYKDIIKKDGSKYGLATDVRMDYLEIGDRFVCGGDHEFESLVLKDIVNEVAIVEITEDFWKPGETSGINKKTIKCSI